MRLSLVFLLAALGAHAQNTFKVVFERSRQPAGGIKVEQRVGEGRPTSLVTGPDGTVTGVPRGGTLTFADPVTGAMLGEFPTPAASGEIAVPEPLRITGRIEGEGDDRKGLVMQVGVGEHIPVMERYRKYFDRFLPPTPTENQVLGLNLPSGPANWASVSVFPDGRFETPWFTTREAPQLLARNAAYAYALQDVPLPSVIRPRQVIDAGALRLTPTRSVRVEVTDVPPADIALDVQLFLEKGTINPAAREAALRYLGALDRIDPRLFVFVARLRPYYIEAATTTILGLPDGLRAGLRAMGALQQNAADFSVALDASPATIRVSASRTLPANTRTAPLQGKVVWQTTYAPVKGVRIVYSCYPAKKETVSDDFGNFVFPDACVDQPVTLFADARDTRRPARFTRRQVKRVIDRRAAPLAPVILELPSGDSRDPRGKRLKTPTPTKEDLAERVPLSPAKFMVPWPSPPEAFVRRVNLGNSDDDPDYPIVFVFQPGFLSEQPQTVIYFEQNSELKFGVKLAQPAQAAQTARVAYSPFLYREAINQNFQSGQAAVELSVASCNYVAGVNLFFFRPGGQKVKAGTAVYFTSSVDDPDPVEFDTDRSGRIELGALCTQYLYIFVSDPNMGYYNGPVQLDTRTGTGVVTLQSYPPENAPAAPPRGEPTR